MSKSWHPQTRLIREQIPRSGQQEHSAPVYLTSSFVFDDAEQARALFADEIEGNLYSRFTNPNPDEFIRRLCLLEGAESGVACATGMAAITLSLLGVLKAGDHLVAARDLFGSTHQILTRLLPRFGIEHSYVPIDDLEAYQRAIRSNTRMILLETPSNPGLKLADLQALGQLADAHGLLLNVDNTFATPWLQKPLEFGAHLVTHSATKFIDGQGRVMGGAVLGKGAVVDEIRWFARQTGPSLSPFNAWVLSKSLETLPVRMDRHCDNALYIARALENQPGLAFVRHPELPSHPQHELARRQMRRGGAMVCFELEGGLEAGRRFLDRLQLCSLSANLGDSRSIATHPASTTHAKLSEEDRQAVGITPGLIRLSVGLEHPDDILQDLLQALEQAG